MTRTLFAASVLALSLSSFSRGDDAKGADKMMQGTWVPSAAEMAGKPFPDAVLKTMKLVVKDDKYTVTVGAESDEGTLKFDTAAKPKAVDVIGGDAGPNKGKTFLAIYERDGDTLRICYDLEGKNRPTEFKSKEGTKTFFVTYQSAKP